MDGLKQDGNNQFVDAQDAQRLSSSLQTLQNQDEDYKVRIEAARALSDWSQNKLLDAQKDKIIKVLVQTIQDRGVHFLVRQKIADALGKWSLTQLTDALLAQIMIAFIQALQDSSYFVRWLTVEALAKLGPPQIPDELKAQIITALLQTLQDDDIYVKSSTAKMLGDWSQILLTDEQNDQIISALLQAFKDQDRNIRSVTAKTLGKWSQAPLNDAQKTKIITSLLQALQDNFREVRSASAQALGKWSLTQLSDELKAQIITALLEARYDQHTGVKRSIVKGLGKISQIQLSHTQKSKIVTALIQSSMNIYKDVQLASTKALGKWGRAALTDAQKNQIITALTQVLKGHHKKVGLTSAKILGKWSQAPLNDAQKTKIITSLLQALQDNFREVRSASAQALGKWNPTSLSNAHKSQIITALLNSLQNLDNHYEIRQEASKALDDWSQALLSDEQIEQIISGLLKALKYNKNDLTLNTLRTWVKLYKSKLPVTLFKQVLYCFTNPLSYITEQSIILAVQKKQISKLIENFNEEKIEDLINNIELNDKSTEYIVATIEITDAIGKNLDQSTGEYYKWMENKARLVDELVLKLLFDNEGRDVPKVSELFLSWPVSIPEDSTEQPLLHQLLKDMYYFWSESALHQFEVAYVTKHIKEICIRSNSTSAKAICSLEKIELSEHFLSKVVPKLVDIFTDTEHKNVYRKQVCSELNALACKVIFPEELRHHVLEQLSSTNSDTVVKYEVPQALDNMVKVRKHPAEGLKEYAQSSLSEPLLQQMVALKIDQVLTEEDWDIKVNAAETLTIASESGIYEALAVHQIILERSAQTQYPKLLKIHLIEALLNFESDDEKLVLLTTQILGRWLKKTLPQGLQEKIINHLKGLTKDHKSQKVRGLAQQSLDSVKQSQAVTKESCSLPAVTTGSASPVGTCDLQSAGTMPHSQKELIAPEGGASKDMHP